MILLQAPCVATVSLLGLFFESIYGKKNQNQIQIQNQTQLRCWHLGRQRSPGRFKCHNDEMNLKVFSAMYGVNQQFPPAETCSLHLAHHERFRPGL